MIWITKRIEFDAGHRVRAHESKCRSPHGHRYTCEVMLIGDVVVDGPEDGMVLDFGHVKTMLMTHVHEPWDHAFILAHDDPLVMLFCSPPGGEQPYKVDLVQSTPTAENLAEIASQRLSGPVAEWSDGRVTLSRVTIWETPTCSATWVP